MNFELLLNAKVIYTIYCMFLLFIFGLMWSTNGLNKINKVLNFILGSWACYELLIMIGKINYSGYSYSNGFLWGLSIYFLCLGLVYSRSDLINLIIKCIFFLSGVTGIIVMI